MNRPIAITFVACLVFVAACEPTPRNAFFENRSDTVVSVYDVGTDGSLAKWGDLRPNSKLSVNLFTDGCSQRAFVVTDANQKVLKRFDRVCYQATYSYP